MTNHQWKDNDAAMSALHGFKVLEKLGFPEDQMIESATMDLIGSGLVKLNVTFVLSVKQLKQMGVDLNA